MNVVGFTSADVCARGVAAVATESPNCIYALNPTEEYSLQVSSGEALLDAECGVVVNSNNPKGLYVASGACMTVASISVTGPDYYHYDNCDIPGWVGPSVQPEAFVESPPEPRPPGPLGPASHGGGLPPGLASRRNNRPRRAAGPAIFVGCPRITIVSPADVLRRSDHTRRRPGDARARDSRYSR